MSESLQRIYAILLRHFYILRGSPARLIEIIYWPTMQMILWGFISQFFAHKSLLPMNYAMGTLLGAVLLWDLLFRSQLGVSLSFLEEVWSRNLGHLFVSPLRPLEWWVSMMFYSIVRALLGMGPAVVLAIPFYGFSIFGLGLPLLLLFLNLMIMGWALGFLITAVLIKAGPGAESISWGLTFFLAPFCAVYYPVAMLPAWLQKISYALPASHVFEGLRTLVQEGGVDTYQLSTAFVLNCVYIIISIILLQMSFNNARKHGTLLQIGE
ncbi:MAG: ABC transporter permease [Proteobacteria bacterium]|nr:ABC transporter permease [Pseudomonadota bacterium]